MSARTEVRGSNRTSPQTFCRVLDSVNGYEYFKHTSYTTVFRNLDGLIRRRLRRILLKRHRKHDHNGRGLAHYRWPNAYFAEHGLFSMETAHVRLRQSVAR